MLKNCLQAVARIVQVICALTFFSCVVAMFTEETILIAPIAVIAVGVDLCMANLVRRHPQFKKESDVKSFFQFAPSLSIKLTYFCAVLFFILFLACASLWILPQFRYSVRYPNASERFTERFNIAPATLGVLRSLPSCYTEVYWTACETADFTEEEQFEEFDKYILICAYEKVLLIVFIFMCGVFYYLFDVNHIRQKYERKLRS